MEELEFECPHCAQHLSAGPEFYGTEKGCPNCGGRFIVPRPEDFVEGPPPGSTEAVNPAALEQEINETPAVKFLCPGCDRKLSATVREIGKEMPCPYEDCRVSILVPRPEWKPMPTSIIRKGPKDPNELVRRGEALTHRRPEES